MTRIIAKLDVKPPYVVKPVHFEGLRKIGYPEELTKKYYSQGIDEIFYIDIVASLYRRKILCQYVKDASKGLFVPFAVGGGVTCIDDFHRLFQSGADKVVLNTHAVQHDASIIDKAVQVFGSQAVVINIEAKKLENEWNCYTDCGRIASNKTVTTWSKEVESRGAGEILLQSVDRDGRKGGFDIELSKVVVESLAIPVVVASGAGSLEDIKKLVDMVNPSGIALSSILHYDEITVDALRSYLVVS